MLKSILNLDGATALSREEKANIKGAFRGNFCPSEGENCSVPDPTIEYPACFGGEQSLYCINGIWRPGDYCSDPNTVC